MIKLYSNVEQHAGELLHICYSTYKDAFNGVTQLSKNVIRQDLIPEDEFLQLAHITIKNAGHKFRPHKHLYKPALVQNVIAQESWVILSGKIKAIFYDLDDTIIHTEILKEGDVSITLRGGHTYEVLDNNTQVLEFKTGPYEGQLLDKQFIEEKE
jgi:hypothetical protein